MDFESTEHALTALENAAKSMDAHPALASVAALQRRATAYLRERTQEHAAAAAESPRRKR